MPYHRYLLRLSLNILHYTWIKRKMADNHSKEVRSMNMSHIRSKDTKPEIIVRSFFIAMASVLEKMINGIRVNQISYCQNIKQLSISTAVFGICTIVKTLYGLNRTRSIGLTSSLITRTVTKSIMTK